MTISVHVGFDSLGYRSGTPFFIERPSEQPGLLEVVPKGTRPVAFINHYHVDEQVRCAFCDTHRPHNKGVTVEMADGSIALCGNQCAEHFFGHDVAKHLFANLRVKIDRERKRRLIAQTFVGLEAVGVTLTEQVVEAERWGRRLITAVRDALSGPIVTGIVSGEVAGVHGRFLSLAPHYSHPLSQKIEGILRHLERVKLQSEDMSDDVLQKAVDSRQRLIRWIEDLAGFLVEMRRFMDPENLRRLVEYVESRHSARVLSFKNPVTGPQLQVTCVGAETERFPLQPIPAFDREAALSLLNGGDVDVGRQSQYLVGRRRRSVARRKLDAQPLSHRTTR